MLVGFLGFPLAWIAFFVARKTWIKQFNKRSGDVEKLDLVFVVRQNRKFQIAAVIFFALISVAVLVVYLWKVSQTPDIVLLYDRRVQSQMVTWELCVGGLFAFTLFMAGGAIGMLTVYSRIKNELINKFRLQISSSDENSDRGYNAVVESWLRQLGA